MIKIYDPNIDNLVEATQDAIDKKEKTLIFLSKQKSIIITILKLNSFTGDDKRLTEIYNFVNNIKD